MRFSLKKPSAWAFAILVISVAMLPLVVSAQTMDAVLVPRFLVLSIVIFIVSFHLLFSHKKSSALAFFKSKIAWPFYLFFISFLVSSFHLINTAEAFFSIAQFSLFFGLLFSIIRILGNSQKRRLVLMKAFLIAFLFIIAFAFIQFSQIFFGSKGEMDLYQITSTMGHRNLLASILVLLFPVALFGSFYLKNTWKILSVLLGILAVFLIVFLQARASLLALAGMSVFLLSIFSLKKTKIARWKFPVKVFSLLFSSLVLVGFFTFYFWPDEQKPNAGLHAVGFSGDGDKSFTANERILLWKATLRMVKNQPLTGVGAGQWKIWFPKYGSDIWRSRQGQVQFQRPHNDYLWVLSENGILGLLAFLFMGITVIFCGLSIFFSTSISKEKQALALCLSAIIFAYAIVAFFSFPKERIMHQVILYSVSALLFSLYFDMKNEDFKTKKSTFVGINLTFLIVSGLCIFMGIQRWRGEVQTKKILQARLDGNWSQILRENRSIQNLAFYNIDPTSVPIPFYSGLAHLNLNQNQAAQDDFEKAYKIHPYNIHVVNNLAGIYQFNNHPNKAIEYYQKALEISPKYVEGVLNVAALYFNENEVEKAYEILKKNAGLFALDGKGDPRYEQYLLVILKTVRDNLRDSATNPATRERLQNLTESDLLKIHYAHLQQDSAVSKIILQAASQPN